MRRLTCLEKTAPAAPAKPIPPLFQGHDWHDDSLYASSTASLETMAPDIGFGLRTLLSYLNLMRCALAAMMPALLGIAKGAISCASVLRPPIYWPGMPATGLDVTTRPCNAREAKHERP